MAYVNRQLGVVESYKQRSDGEDEWVTEYDPKVDDISVLERVLYRIKKDERKKFIEMLQDIIQTIE
jgi:hypothetical protein